MQQGSVYCVNRRVGAAGQEEDRQQRRQRLMWQQRRAEETMLLRRERNGDYCRLMESGDVDQSLGALLWQLVLQRMWNLCDRTVMQLRTMRDPARSASMYI